MYTSLMGTFDLPALINYIGSTSVGNSIATVVDRTDPWVLPSHHEPEVPLSKEEVAYQAITHTTVDPIPLPLTVSEELEEAYLHAWAEKSLHSVDCLDMVLPSDEAMCGRGKICEDLHHRSYFLPELSRIENQEFHMRLEGDVDTPINPLPREGIFAEGKMEKKLLLFLSTSLQIQTLWKMYILVQNSLQTRLLSIQPCLRNSVTCFPCHMRRFQA